MGRIITPSNNFDKRAAHKNFYTILPLFVNRWTAETSQTTFFFCYCFPTFLPFSLRVIRDFLTVPMFLHLSESIDSSSPFIVYSFVLPLCLGRTICFIYLYAHHAFLIEHSSTTAHKISLRIFLYPSRPSMPTHKVKMLRDRHQPNTDRLSIRSAEICKL